MRHANPYEEKPRTPGMKQALEALDARRGPVPDRYTPPVSTFPMTPAARAAKAMSKKRYKSPY